MNHTQIKPGAYRALFQDALKVYREQAPPEELAVIDHYLKLLDNPDYKFGSMQYNTPNYASGEFFFRS